MPTRPHTVSYETPPEGFPGSSPKPQRVVWFVLFTVSTGVAGYAGATNDALGRPIAIVAVLFSLLFGAEFVASRWA